MDPYGVILRSALAIASIVCVAAIISGVIACFEGTGRGTGGDRTRDGGNGRPDVGARAHADCL
jgi:hypothetical protein